MKSLLIALLTLAPLAAQPALAASIEDHPSASQQRIGAFAGARFRVALGGEQSGQPRLGLAMSGIDYRRSPEGGIRVGFAEGAEYGLAADREIGLSLAGQSLRTGKDRLHASGGGGLSPNLMFAAIIGAVVVLGGVGLATALDD